MRPNAESVTRSVTKSLSWRVIASLTTFLLVFLLTGKIEAALSISALEIILKMLLYFFHERLWQRIGFGRKNTTPAVIWFTGLSGSGKSTIGKQVAEALRKQGHQVEWLDGDLTREFFPQTGFSKEERDAHVLRSGFLARTLEKKRRICGCELYFSLSGHPRAGAANVSALHRNPCFDASGRM